MRQADDVHLVPALLEALRHPEDEPLLAADVERTTSAIRMRVEGTSRSGRIGVAMFSPSLVRRCSCTMRLGRCSIACVFFAVGCDPPAAAPQPAAAGAPATVTPATVTWKRPPCSEIFARYRAAVATAKGTCKADTDCARATAVSIRRTSAVVSRTPIPRGA